MNRPDMGGVLHGIMHVPSCTRKYGPGRPGLQGSRKGFMYLIVASFMVAIIIAIFIISKDHSYKDQQLADRDRIIVMNDFVRSTNADIERAARISAFRTLVSLEDSITAKGIFLNDTEESFNETFFYGTIDGVPAALMENSSLEDYLLKVQDLADDLGISVDIAVHKIRLSQPDPWHITVTVVADVNITDMRGMASWTYSRDFVSELPIDDLRDPLYSKYTFNKLPNVIRRVNSSMLVNGTDTAMLEEHIRGSYYIASSSAPSFLDRFEGEMGADANGIESIVNIVSLSDQYIDVHEGRVKVDYIYFTSNETSGICAVQGIDQEYHFIIPADRMDAYQITALNHSTCT